MATLLYNENPATITITNNAVNGVADDAGSRDRIKIGTRMVQLYKTNQWVILAPGNKVTLTGLSSPEIAYYASLASAEIGVDLLQHKVTYKANTGVGDDVVAYEDSDNKVVAILPSFTKTDNTFSKWNTAAAGTGTDYAAGATITLTADLVLYAIWEASGG